LGLWRRAVSYDALRSIYDDLDVEYDDLNPDYDDLKSIYDDLPSGRDDLRGSRNGMGLMDLKADAKTAATPATPLHFLALLPGNLFYVVRIDFKPQRLTATAGARSVHFTIPLSNQEFALRLMTLPGVMDAYENMGLSSLNFDHDHWLLLRLLSISMNRAHSPADQWSVKVLVIPRATLIKAVKRSPELENNLLKVVISESQSNLQSARLSNMASDIALSSKLNTENKIHFNELLQIITNQRLGFGPARDESLAPLEKIQEMIFSSGAMKIPTLKKRIPGLIFPKHFDLAGTQSDFFYYSLRKLTIQNQC